MVFVLSSDGQPLDPCHHARARELLKAGRAAVWRRFPFTIRLRDRMRAESVVHDHRLKVDPGSKTSGIAVVQDGTDRVLFAAELSHRGSAIHDALTARRAVRRSRRNRKTRYRKPRYLNRRRPGGWLAPSLLHRVLTTETWVKRLMRLCPITAISMELVRFDMQLLRNPDISGVDYQQGSLAGYELREYVLERDGRRCAYCSVTGVPLELDHLIPESRGGPTRADNLTPACHECNQRKGNRTAFEYGFPQLMDRVKQPLGDAAAVNSVRWATWHRLAATGLALEVSTGGRTKYNRTQRLGWPKTHWRDAAAVGASTPAQLTIATESVLLIVATGHGNRQMCRTNKHGFPIRHVPRQKRHFGFRTGDMVRAVVPLGKYAGVHVGRVSIRSRPSFRLNGIDVHAKYLTLLQRADGYAYALGRSGNAQTEGAASPGQLK